MISKHNCFSLSLFFPFLSRNLKSIMITLRCINLCSPPWAFARLGSDLWQLGDVAVATISQLWHSWFCLILGPWKWRSKSRLTLLGVVWVWADVHAWSAAEEHWAAGDELGTGSASARGGRPGQAKVIFILVGGGRGRSYFKISCSSWGPEKQRPHTCRLWSSLTFPKPSSMWQLENKKAH